MQQAKTVSAFQFTRFGELLKFLRRRARFTQRELANVVGCSESQISRMEHNQRVPDPNTLAELFVPLLNIRDEQEWSTRLLELAETARGRDEGEPGWPLHTSRQVMRIPMQVQLLGGFGITYADKLVNGLNASRLQSLIAYLILTTNIPQARQHIAFILWPDTSEAKGRNNLRQLLYQLRHLLPDYDRFIDIEDDTVTWRLDDNQSIDIQRFVRALDEAESAEQRSNVNEERRWLAEALSIYRGDLLPGCYDEWILSYRERLKHRRMQANQKLVQILEQQRDYPSALQAAESLLNLDPLDESTYLTLMRLHELNHDQAASRRVYYSAVKTLQLELGVEPGEMLRQEYERLQIPSAKRYPRKSSLPVHLVGRQNEWQQLQVAWGQALDGGTYFVLITGEAGIGKSRLAEELFQWAAQQGITCAHARCYAAEGRLSLAPVTEWLRSPDLRQHLGTLDRMWLTELARVLPELMSDRPDLARPEPISEYGRRQRFFEAIARGVLLAPLPILLWIDDLQWCDPETLEWLHFLLRFEPHKPLLVLGTARSEESPPDHPLIDLSRQLRAEDKFARIELSPLDAAETGQLASMTSGVEFDVRATTRLFHETEGNPLFVVEMVRAGFSGITQDEAARLAGADQELPPRVHAIIARRLAHLSILARKIAELGALTGREFSLDLILRAGQDDEANVILALDELWQKRIFHEQGANVFDFTHDKLREVMISEIPVPQRRLLHRHIAQALEAMYTGNLDPVSGQIAAQYEQAGMPDQAVPYYQRAAAVAAGVYANEDAITMLRRGISLLDQLPAGDRHDRLELMIQMALAPLYRITRGWTSPEVEACTNRAMVLCEKVGNISQRTQILFGLQSLYVVQSRLEKVETTYALAHKLYLQTNHTTPPPFTAIMYAGTKLHMGELQTSSDMFEKIVALHDDAYILDLQESQGVNYIVHGYAWNAHALWLLGYPQMAINSGQAAVQVARQDAQPFNQALAITYLSLLQEWNAAPGRFAGQAEEALQLSGEYKAPYYYAWSNILACFARAQQQPDAEHLTSLRKAIRDFTNSGAHLRMPYYLSLLARAWSSAGKPEKGLAVIEEGLAEALQHNEHWWDAELHRLRGELRLSQGAAADEVEGAFSRAIEIARSQEARSLELRAATSLARLRYANGGAAEARQLLQPLIAWFTEGFDTPDLQAAQTLIQQSSE